MTATRTSAYVNLNGTGGGTGGNGNGSNINAIDAFLCEDIVVDNLGNAVIDSCGEIVTTGAVLSTCEFVTSSPCDAIVTDINGDPITVEAGVCKIPGANPQITEADLLIVAAAGNLVDGLVYDIYLQGPALAVSTTQFVLLAPSGGGTGTVSTQTVVLDIVANVPKVVIHTFTTEVSNYRAYNSLNEEIELSYMYNPATKQLEVCSVANLTNVTIKLEGVL